MRPSLFVAGFSVVLCGAAWGQDNDDVELYTDYVVGVWEDWSTAWVETQSTTYVLAHEYAMRVAMLPGTSVRFHHTWGGQNTTGLSNLEFWIHGGSTGGQQLWLSATVWGDPRPPVHLSGYATVRANKWTRVRIPLSHLGAQNVRGLRDIYIGGFSSVRDFWLDSIRLTSAPESALPEIQVDAVRYGQTITSRMFGVAARTWDEVFAIPTTQSRIVEGGFTILTFPGGTTGNTYDWLHNRVRDTGALGRVSTNTFLEVADAVGADKMITVNYGSGTPPEARDWLRYANFVRGSNVLYWVVGNECYGPWEYDLHPYPHDALTYAAFVRDCYRLMKAVDPRIKIGISGTIGEADFAQRVSVTNPRTGTTANGWAPVLLSKLAEYGVVPDFYDFHFYPSSPRTENDSYLLQSGKTWDFLTTSIRRMLRDYLGPAGDNVPIYVNEVNSTFDYVGKQTASIVNALYLVKSWARALHNGVEAFSWWNLHNSADTEGNNSPTLHGWRNFGDYGVLASGQPAGGSEPINTPYPTFYAFKMLKAFARPGDRMVTASSNNDLISVAACRSAGSGRLRLLVLNESKYAEISASISLNGYELPAEATMYRYGMTQDEGRQDVEIRRLAIIGTTSRNNLSFPPYSITVLEL